MLNKIYVWKCLKENQEKGEQETDNENSVSVPAHINQISLTHRDTQCSTWYHHWTVFCYGIRHLQTSRTPTRLQTFLILVQNRSLNEQPWGVMKKKSIELEIKQL